MVIRFFLVLFLTCTTLQADLQSEFKDLIISGNYKKHLVCEHGAITILSDAQTKRGLFVLKKRSATCSQQEVLIPKIVQDLFGKASVAFSFFVENEFLGEDSFTGLVEEYICAMPVDGQEVGLPKDLEVFIKKFSNPFGGIMLDEVFRTLAQMPEQEKQQWTQTLYTHLDSHAMEVLFLSTLVLNLDDTEPRNVALRINDFNKLELVSFDNEAALSPVLTKTCILQLPVMHTGLSSNMRACLQNWGQEPCLGYKQDIETLRDPGAYTNLQRRIEAVRKFVINYPETTYQGLVSYAFYDLEFAQTAQSSYERLHTYGIRLFENAFSNKRVGAGFIETYTTTCCEEEDETQSNLGAYFKQDYSSWMGMGGAFWSYMEKYPQQALCLSEFMNFVQQYQGLKKGCFEDFKKHSAQLLGVDSI